ncbi:MAG TPA: hypothetical protein VH599_04710 [Ktedonobacterales bacterium]
MPYPQAFFDIQFTFARNMTQLSRQPYHESLLRQTALYRIMGLDWSLDTSNPVWQQFLETIEVDSAETAAAYRFYMERAAQGLIPEHEPAPHWGCFSYEFYADLKVARMHFSNWDASGYGPLSHHRQQARMGELQAMFHHIHQELPDAERVQGGTWLYNRKEYCRLFPPEYGASAQVDHPHLLARKLWGQFLRHGNRMNEEVTARFLEKVERLQTAEAYASCFPYQNLVTDAPITLFYTFYGLAT